MSGFSTVLPYGKLFFAMQVAVISPIQFFIEGLMHAEYGYEIFHRIFGEYKFNKQQILNIFDFSGVVFSAIFDAALFCLFYAAWAAYTKTDLQI